MYCITITQNLYSGGISMFNEKTMALLNKYNSGIGLDISRTSTGVCIWYNGILSLYRIVTPYKYSKIDSLWEAKMKRSFKKDLLEIVKGKHFEIAVIENTINGCNAITNKELVLLNSVFDDLVLEKLCTIEKGKLYRMECSSWRKYLGGIAPVKKVKDTKLYCESMLDSLDCSFVLDNKDLSINKKKQIGYFDICDSIGILLGGMLKDKSKEAE